MLSAHCTHSLCGAGWFAALVLALTECQVLLQVIQMRRHPAMRWLTDRAAAQQLARAGQALDSSRAHLRKVKAWLPPTKQELYRKQQQAIAQQLEQAARTAPSAGGGGDAPAGTEQGRA